MKNPKKSLKIQKNQQKRSQKSPPKRSPPKKNHPKKNHPKKNQKSHQARNQQKNQKMLRMKKVQKNQVGILKTKTTPQQMMLKSKIIKPVKTARKTIILQAQMILVKNQHLPQTQEPKMTELPWIQERMTHHLILAVMIETTLMVPAKLI